VATGFEKLDKITSGWQPSDLIIIAARPAMVRPHLYCQWQIWPLIWNASGFIFIMASVQLITRLIL
jgi:replicative DNA helicase